MRLLAKLRSPTLATKRKSKAFALLNMPFGNFNPWLSDAVA
jgi:hypothetical protein